MATARTKQTQQSRQARQQRSRRVGLVMAAVLVVVATALASFQSAAAETVLQQVQRLQRENAANQQAVNNLAAQAVSYQDAIKRADGQIKLLRASIADNQAKQSNLQTQIFAKQIELSHQRATLGESIKSIYVKGRISSLEMLATSKTISDYIDAETYRTAVQLKIQHNLEEVSRLQNILSSQKQRIDQLLADQQRQQYALQTVQNQQAQLLAYNTAQQADYNARTAANKLKIASLIGDQARLNDDINPNSYYFLRFPGTVKTFDPNAYPYKNAAFSMNTSPGCVDNDGPDKWGYCTRQCVSYTAWAVEASGRSAPTFYGNARDWVAAAQRDGIPVLTGNPRVGDVAISTAGTWGHAMYVEQVDGNRIFVSQYNAQLNGQYSTQWRNFNNQ